MATTLSRNARRYVAAVVMAALAAGLAAAAWPSAGLTDLAVLAALAAGAAVGQVYVIEIRANHGFPTGLAFVVAGALLLPLELVALVAIAQYLPELILRRTPAVIQVFNAANGVLNALAAWAVADVLLGALGDGGSAFAVAGLAAAATFVLLNHVLLAIVLRLARGHSLRATGLFSVESLSIDFVLAAMGVAAASLGDWNAALVPAALAPLLFAHRFLRLLAAGSPAPPEPSPATTL